MSPLDARQRVTKAAVLCTAVAQWTAAHRVIVRLREELGMPKLTTTEILRQLTGAGAEDRDAHAAGDDMSTQKSQKAYLGDSVYADYDGFGIVLTTENGYLDDPRNRIVLEPAVLATLLDYAYRVGARARPDPSCHACGGPIEVGESVAVYHEGCDRGRPKS